MWCLTDVVFYFSRCLFSVSYISRTYINNSFYKKLPYLSYKKYISVTFLNNTQKTPAMTAIQPKNKIVIFFIYEYKNNCCRKT